MTATCLFWLGDSFWLADVGVLAEAGNLSVNLECDIEPVDVAPAASEPPGVENQPMDEHGVFVYVITGHDHFQVAQRHFAEDAVTELEAHLAIPAEYQPLAVTIRKMMDDLQFAVCTVGNVCQPTGKEPESVLVVSRNPIDLDQETPNASWLPDCHDLSKVRSLRSLAFLRA